MKFSLKLLDVKCNKVLSVDDSPWGEEDGIRVFFLVFNGSGYRELRVSGREYPPPDVNETYHFKPGKKLDLANFPPQKFPDWEMPVINLSEWDEISVAVVGLNEGLPSMGGGGGYGKSNKATIEGFEELVKKMSDKAAEAKKSMMDVAANPAVSAAFDLLKSYIEQLNEETDCRGVAFALEAEFPLQMLFKTHLKQKHQIVTLDAASAANALHIVALGNRPADCADADYEVRMQITCLEPFALKVEEKVLAEEIGAPRPLDTPFEVCKPKGRPVYVWPIYHDRSFTIRPTIPRYATLKPIWVVEGQKLPEHGNGTLQLLKKVDKPVELAMPLEHVNVDYQVVTLGDQLELQLRTYGKDGNYTLNAGLYHFFEDNQPMTLFREEDLFVTGEGMGGDQNYQNYVSCLGHIERTIRKYVVVPAVGIRPDMRLEEVIRFEHNVVQLARILWEEVDLPAVELDEPRSSDVKGSQGER